MCRINVTPEFDLREAPHFHILHVSPTVYCFRCSAGGTGVLINLDRVASLLGRLAPRIEVRGIADSGWFLDNKQYQPIRCTAPHTCAPTDGIPRGIRSAQYPFFSLVVDYNYIPYTLSRFSLSSSFLHLSLSPPSPAIRFI